MNAVAKKSNITDVQQRKDYLINELNKLGVDKTEDGRKINGLSLYSLEWTHIVEKNKVARAYGERS